ncbi:uncharacterized protein LOC133033861 [Cannabis sativa]|uniref:uncharacterized protein LOC133033861 n=1 Tax=Cannabis sativa TaxID=3483 RepID=UPI0029CA2000|nr:uncharacterized protein LOC133033861 [Cannabis sativa]
MSKAYDRIEWDFLEAMLRKLGFVENWILLVMKCVKSARYCVTRSNNEVGPIIPTRGIRQGDPLSPYLFILWAEGFTALPRKYEQKGWLHGTNTLDAMKDRINTILGMTTATEGSLYLGLPSSMGRNKSAALAFLKNKVKNRLLGYGTKFLSRAGKEILIKTVAQALSSYAMSVFLIPQEVTRDIEGLMSKFWWQSSNNSPKGIH